MHTKLSGPNAPNADSLSKRRDQGATRSMGYKAGRNTRRYVSWSVSCTHVRLIHIFWSELEAVLIQGKILIPPKIPLRREAPLVDSDSDGDEDNDVCLGGAGKKKRNIRNSAKKEDSDSDFDL